METLRPFVEKEILEDFAKQVPELDVTSVETCLAFLHTTADVYAALNTHFARYGLSMGKFTLLMQLLHASKQGLTPSECAERAKVSRATITGLLDGLERDDYIRRQPSSTDRRMLTVHLTEKGHQLLSNMLPDHFCRTTKLMANLSYAEKLMLIELLGKVSAGAPAMSNE